MKSIILILICIFILTSCVSDNIKIDNERRELDVVCKKINKDFKRLVVEIDETTDFIEKLYNKENVDKNLKTIDKNQYVLSNEGIFYRKNYQDTSAVFVSGYIPINEKIKETVYFTEPLDKYFKEKIRKNSEIVQIYYDTKDSYLRIYPGINVLSQFQAKIDLTSFNFYYLADEKHNPSKKAVWVNEPYIDLAGKGWMISLIKPLYLNMTLEGVPGMDITLSNIIDKYLVGNNKDILILSEVGTIVAVTDKTTKMLSLPSLKDSNFIETLKSNVYMPENFNLLKSKKKNIRALAERIIDGKESIYKFENENQKYTVVSSKIDEVKWIGVKFIKQ